MLVGPKYIDIMLAKAGALGLYAEGDPPGGGGGGGEPAPNDGGGGGQPTQDGDGKTFTQEQVNALIAKERRATEQKLSERFSDYDNLKERAAKVDELEQQIEELRDKADKRPAEQKELEKLQKQLSTLQNQLSEKEKVIAERESLVQQEREKRFRYAQDTAISQALQAAKVFAEASDDALASFRSNAEIESDDEGNIVSVTIGGQMFQDVKEAAAKFLEMKPHFAAANVGGGGTRRPNGSAPRDLSNARSADLISSGLRDRGFGRST